MDSRFQNSAAVRAPGPLRLALEGRAPWEFAALVAAAPWLRRQRAGDGHPVIVFPGLAVSDFTTLPMRSLLRDHGYAAYPWEMGFNLGPRDGVLDACLELLERTAGRHGSKVSMIGWSLGGVYARELAKARPDLARCVITLGSPFAGHPRATNAWRLFELVSGKSVHDPALLAEIRRAPPVPTTSIYSRTDGVVAWQCSVNEDKPHTENIEVAAASHVGMGLNPLVLYAIVDRLAQHPDRWQRFDTSGARGWFYRTGAPDATRRSAPGPRGRAAA